MACRRYTWCCSVGFVVSETAKACELKKLSWSEGLVLPQVPNGICSYYHNAFLQLILLQLSAGFRS